MKSRRIVTASAAFAAFAVFAAGGVRAQIPFSFPQPAGPGMHAPQDVREPALLAMCKHQPRPMPPLRGGGARAQTPPFSYHVQAIPGVIAAGARWRIVWAANGNNADGLIGLPDGSIMMAQNDDSAVVRIYPDGRAQTAYTDTDSGGGLTINHRGQIFIVERALMSSVWELAPQRRLLADSYDGESLDCLGGAGIDGPAALDNGGVYFSMHGLFYADPQGKVTRYGQGVDGPNDTMLSNDQKTLYVGEGGKIIAFDVGPGGVLTHQRVFATIPGGGNDGGGVDADGRVYFEGARPGVNVFSPRGRFLGRIPTPFPVISTAFGGRRHQTLYAVGLDFGPGGLIDEVLAIPTIAKGAPSN